MRIRLYVFLLALVLPCILAAQEPMMVLPAPVLRPELGKWWKNSTIVKQLQLKDSQVTQIEKIFLDHQSKLLSATEALKKREEQLKALMQTEPLQESQIRKTIDQVAATRAELEKMNASMMLSIRMVLSREQWSQLDRIQDSKKTILVRAPQSKTAQKLPAGLKQMEFENTIFSIGDSVKPPQVLQQPKPSYTPQAKAARIEGIVLVSAVIQKDGNIGQIRIKKGLGYGLDESVIDTISKQWKFQPGTLNGKPVNVSVVMEVSFRLY